MGIILEESIQKEKNNLELELKQYENILSKEILEYLYDLLNLEYSVISNFIKEEYRYPLANMDIYRKISMYNIYYKALDLIKKNIENVDIFNFNCLKVTKDNINLFEFKCNTRLELPEIGAISLFQTIENPDLIEKEISRISKIISTMKKIPNPHSYDNNHSKIYKEWEFKNENKLREYNTKLRTLKSKLELSEEEKKEINLTNQIYNLLMSDYNLTKESFNEIEEESYINKTLTKRIPGILIENKIKYI